MIASMFSRPRSSSKKQARPPQVPPRVIMHGNAVHLGLRIGLRKVVDTAAAAAVSLSREPPKAGKTKQSCRPPDHSCANSVNPPNKSPLFPLACCHMNRGVPSLVHREQSRDERCEGKERCLGVATYQQTMRDECNSREEC